MKRFLQITTVFLALLLVNGTALLAQDTQTQETVEDTTKPSDVENVQAAAGNGNVVITWDPATDDVSITGYKIYYGTASVQEDGGEYNMPSIVLGNVLEYTVENLQNGTQYYFAATASDAADNESEHYSFEATATPQEGLRASSVEDNGAAPALAQVLPITNTSVKVLFSEPIVLPLDGPEKAFAIKKTAGEQKLKITAAELDANDEEGATVIITTDPQEANVTYILTAGVEIQDHYENSVIPGAGDSATFRGKGAVEDDDKEKTDEEEEEEEEPAKDKKAPEVTETKVRESTKIEVMFNEAIILSENAKTHFEIYKKPLLRQGFGGQETEEQKSADAEKEILEIKNVSLSKDNKTAYLQTAPQSEVEYVLVMTNVKDAAGNKYKFKAANDENKGGGTGGGTLVPQEEGIVFMGTTNSLKDLVPPEDVTNLIARLKAGSADIVALKWTASANTAGDLDNQLVYVSDDDGKTYDDPESIGKEPVSNNVPGLTPGQKYTFKITAKDTSDNESRGAIVAFRLPETGPGVMALGITSIFAAWYRKRRK